MKDSTLPYWLTLVVVLGVAYGGWHVWKTEQARQEHRLAAAESADQPEPEPLAEFTLVERSGKPFHSQDMRGKVWVASFFFTSCPNICRKMNQIFAATQKLDGLEEVHFVSITCDPDNDTPEVLSKYADQFNADPKRWLFCTGDFDYIQRVGQDVMKLTVLKQVHKEHAVVIDRAGKIRGRFRVTDAGERLKARDVLLECLAEAAPRTTESTDAASTDAESTGAESLARQSGASVP